jgi:cholesterol oxidase
MTWGRRVPTYIPQANEFARKLAALIGGTAMSMTTEILFDMPSTAHILGGCVMADSRDGGVVDERNRTGCSAIRICTSATDPWWRGTSA